uniref:Uncharacterized protein n=1 Tax=Lepeophtheirus salmonis TaxID=72036 RepID=A0A0K2TLC3_LEPSM
MLKNLKGSLYMRKSNEAKSFYFAFIILVISQ